MADTTAFAEFPTDNFDPFGLNGQNPADVTDPEPQYTEPQNVANERKRSAKAKAYEAQVNAIVSAWFKASVGKPGMVADAAALSLYGPNLAEKTGDLAAHDPRIGKFIDALNGGVENPYLAMIAAALPLALQLIRNHEPILEPNPRTFRIPFSKTKKNPNGRSLGIKKFGIKLGVFRHQTDDPERLYKYVFEESSAMRAAMEQQGITIARYPHR